MPWYITKKILKRTNTAPSARSILTDITGEGHIIIPEGVKELADHVFFGCSALTSVSFPKSLTVIHDSAFRGCGSLQLTLPDSLTGIGECAFFGCSHLTLSERLFSLIDKSTLSTLAAISCPISLKDAPVNVRLKLCIGFALHQDKYSDDLRNEYLAHIKKNAAKLVGTAFDYPELLHLMCRETLIPAKSIDAFTEEASNRGSTELTAALLDYQNTIGMAEVSKARERKEKIRERQDETVIERMAERAEHVGIEGLNFAATGGLRMFKSRDKLKEYIAERGGKLQSSMSAKTDYLITNDADSGSEKNKKAAELGIVVISEAKFLNMCTRKKHID